jgi:hypothetical protein
MTLQIYDIARMNFALGNINWALEPINASIVSTSYTVNLGHDDFISVAGTALATVPIMNKSVSHAGWLLCDVIYFAVTPINVAFSRVVMWRTADGLLLFTVDFPEVQSGTTKPFAILRGASSPGLCRI